MISAESSGWRTLTEWWELCRTTDAAGLAADVAPAFLVCKATSALQVPEGPQATMRVNLTLIEAAKRGDDFHAECPAWALRRREDSVYSFISVGRTPNCDVHIPDEGISKLHSIIREGDGGYLVNDAGSRNKTFVEGAEAPRRGEGAAVPVKSGTTLRFGQIETVLLDAQAFYDLVRSFAGGA